MVISFASKKKSERKNNLNFLKYYLRLLHTAEMLLPNMNNSNSTSNSASSTNTTSSGQNPNSGLQQDEHYEHHPHLVYLLNKSDYLNKLDLSKMKNVLAYLMKDSKLIYKGSINDINQSTPGSFLLNSKQKRRRAQGDDSENINFVVLPKLNQADQEINNFNGLPSMDRVIKNLLRELLAVKRSKSCFIGTQSSANQTGQNLSEKRWFTYANKVWDTIRKSTLISEYNRLMT